MLFWCCAKVEVILDILFSCSHPLLQSSCLNSWHSPFVNKMLESIQKKKRGGRGEGEGREGREREREGKERRRREEEKEEKTGVSYIINVKRRGYSGSSMSRVEGGERGEGRAEGRAERGREKEVWWGRRLTCSSTTYKEKTY